MNSPTCENTLGSRLHIRIAQRFNKKLHSWSFASKTNAGVGIPASQMLVRYRTKRMPDCVFLVRYWTCSGFVSFFFSLEPDWPDAGQPGISICIYMDIDMDIRVQWLLLFFTYTNPFWWLPMDPRSIQIAKKNCGVQPFYAPFWDIWHTTMTKFKNEFWCPGWTNYYLNFSNSSLIGGWTFPKKWLLLLENCGHNRFYKILFQINSLSNIKKFFKNSYTFKKVLFKIIINH